jgi:hypothetical protein
MQLMNVTPFAAAVVSGVDATGAETATLVVKGTFDLSGAEAPTVCEEQDPIVWADEYSGEPGASSVSYEADVALFKPAADAVLLADAWPRSASDRSVDVSFEVGRASKRVRVWGDRRWRSALGFHRISRPAPLDPIDLSWERSFGGVDPESRSPADAYDPFNPVGRGFRGKRSRLPVDGQPLPNIEDPRQPIRRPRDRPAPAGFGFVARHWHPRSRLAGTYDEAWMRERMPLCPADFDERYHNAAAPGLVIPGYLQGGERVRIQNATPEGELGFELPRVAMVAAISIREERSPITMNLDTLVIDTRRRRAHLVWRGRHNVDRVIESVDWVRAECRV